MTLHDFDEIRPYEPDELQQVYDRLLANPQFIAVLRYLFPNVPLEQLAQRMKSCKTNLEFQRAFCYDFLEKLLREKSNGYDFDASEIDNTQRYTFVSNHRDIVLDSAVLDKVLVDANFSTTCEIAIGDNLLKTEWIKDLVRINKSFIVERDLPLRQLLLASKRLSQYIHYAIQEKNENVWIAQREGRAKNNDDRTQSAVLKMLAMGGDLKELHIVPLAISYEYDPCDALKANEVLMRSRDPQWKKQPNDDLVSMKTGIFGFKGHIHYHAAPCINSWIDEIDQQLPTTAQFEAIAEKIDREIHLRYRLYPSNYIAQDLLENSSNNAEKYTKEDKDFFIERLNAQLSTLPNVEENRSELTNLILEQYANPLRNQLAALCQR